MKNLKRTMCMLLALVMAIPLVACSEVAKPAADTPTEQDLQYLATDSESEPIPSVPSVTTLAEDFLSEKKVLTDFYWNDVEDWITPKKEVGYSHGDICPSAVFPESEWSPELILESYVEKTAPWASVPQTMYLRTGQHYTYNAEAALWSNDYEHQFAIVDGWLEIDSIRSLPYDCPTGDINPLTLLEKYQAGEWDGDVLWSKDYSTWVTKKNGILQYTRCNPAEHYSETEHAYDCSDSRPFWDGLEEVQGFTLHSHNVDEEHCVAMVECYLDFPNGHVVGHPAEFKFAVGQDDRGSWAVTADNIYHYLQGKLEDAWALKMSPDGFLAVAHSEFDTPIVSDYAYTGDRLVELLPGGEINTLFDGVSAEIDASYGVFWLYFVEDGNLKRWRDFQSEIDIVTIVEDDVVRTVGTAPVFFEKTDGNTYAFDTNYHNKDGNLAICCLGNDGTMEDYVAAWDEFVADLAGGDEYSTDDFAAFCEKVKISA